MFTVTNIKAKKQLYSIRITFHNITVFIFLLNTVSNIFENLIIIFWPQALEKHCMCSTMFDKIIDPFLTFGDNGGQQASGWTRAQSAQPWAAFVRRVCVSTSVNWRHRSRDISLLFGHTRIGALRVLRNHQHCLTDSKVMLLENKERSSDISSTISICRCSYPVQHIRHSTVWCISNCLQND